MWDVIKDALKAAARPAQSLIVNRILDCVNSIRSYDASVNGLVTELGTLCVKKQDIDAEVVEGKQRLQVLTREADNWLERFTELIMREEMKELMKEHRVAIIVVKMMEQHVMKTLLKDSREVFDIFVEVVMNKCNQEARYEDEVDTVEDADYKKVFNEGLNILTSVHKINIKCKEKKSNNIHSP